MSRYLIIIPLNTRIWEQTNSPFVEMHSVDHQAHNPLQRPHRTTGRLPGVRVQVYRRGTESGGSCDEESRPQSR